MTRTRALLHLVAAGPIATLIAAASTIRQPDVDVLVRAENCFVGPASPYAVSIELWLDETHETDALESAVDVCRQALSTLGDAVDPSRSMAIIGHDVVFSPPDPAAGSRAPETPFRFQYLMRRRHDFSHEAYLRRYRDIHVSFGLRTPNLVAYVQHHVDLDRSAILADATGLTDPACDSMSELRFGSVEHFLEGVIEHPEVGREAQEDEERFVDRAASFGFCHRVLQS